MKLSLTTPNTLILGIWHQDGLCAIKAAYRNTDGDLIAGIHQAYGPNPWQCLCESLIDCKAMKLTNLLMVCNDREMVQTFTKPIKLPVISTKEVTIPMKGWSKEQPTIHTRAGARIKRDLFSTTHEGQRTAAYKAETIDEVDEYLWDVARMFMRYQRWLMIYAESIPGTQAYWQECQTDPSPHCQLDDLFA